LLQLIASTLSAPDTDTFEIADLTIRICVREISQRTAEHRQVCWYDRRVLLVFDQYSFDEANRELRCGAALVKVDPQQLELLALFLRHPGDLLSRQQIIDDVWDGRPVGDSVLSVSVAKLRKALGRTRDNRDYIESSYGRGYRFVHEVRSQQPLRAAPVQPPRSTPHSPLVGRTEPFGRLVKVVEQAQAGRGRVCLITGEKGIGKTRLAASLTEHVHSRGGMCVAWACFQQDANAPLEPLRQVLRELGRQGLTTPEVDTLDAMLAQGTVVTHATLDALAQTILAASRGKPLLLIFDNLHWTDGASLSALTYLADELAHARIAIVATLRYEHHAADARRDVVRLWNHRNCQRVELGRLSPAHVSEYVRAHFGEDSLDSADFSRRLYQRSEGHPFFMVELLRAVDLAQGKKLSLPESTLALMRERLRGLPVGTRMALRAAAVLGHDFDMGVLSHVTEQSAEALFAALAAALTTQTIVATPGTTGSYRFDHELLREVLYNELSVHERGHMHLRAGQGLMSRRDSGCAVSDAELAHHFLAAQPFGDIDIAVSYAQAAANEAQLTAAHAEVQPAIGMLLRSDPKRSEDLAAC
jgi:DNA-binding winged helix-turn-helix (wHTH) protein